MIHLPLIDISILWWKTFPSPVAQVSSSASWPRSPPSASTCPRGSPATGRDAKTIPNWRNSFCYLVGLEIVELTIYEHRLDRPPIVECCTCCWQCFGQWWSLKIVPAPYGDSGINEHCINHALAKEGPQHSRIAFVLAKSMTMGSKGSLVDCKGVAIQYIFNIFDFMFTVAAYFSMRHQSYKPILCHN